MRRVGKSWGELVRELRRIDKQNELVVKVGRVGKISGASWLGRAGNRASW